MMRSTTWLLALALTGSTIAAACGGPPPAATPEPTPSATAPAAPSASAPAPSSSSDRPAAERDAKEHAEVGAAEQARAGGRAITPSAMGEKLTALGIDTKALPPFDKLTGEQKRKVMPLFKQALGYAECTGCHVEGDFKKETKHMKIAEKMWDHFASSLRLDGGGLLFCDSCHGGSEHILGKDSGAVKKFMHDEYVDKLDRADGKAHDCKTCHGDKLELDIVGKVWKL